MSVPKNNELVVYVVSQELAKISSLLPSNKNRSMYVHSLVTAMKIFSQDGSASSGRTLHIQKPYKATYKDLSAYHTHDYLTRVLRLQITAPEVQELDGDHGLEDDCPNFNGLPLYIELIAGASLKAANALREGAHIAICWDGGRHHAHKSRASGFCYVADCVLAILALKRHSPTRPSTPLTSPYSKPRVMYLDLDLHFSDAVSQSFYMQNPSATPQVLTLSVHHAGPGFFPISPLSGLPNTEDPSFDPFTLSLPLLRGATNSTFARIWPLVERVKELFGPDFVVVQCGVDGLAGDPCATWNWSLGDERGSMGWCIGRIVDYWGGRKLLLGGGGYNTPNAARAWTYLTSIAVGNPLSLDSEIADHPAFPAYGPSFNLDVPAGNMQDQNTEQYLESVEVCFEAVCSRLQQRLLSEPSS